MWIQQTCWPFGNDKFLLSGEKRILFLFFLTSQNPPQKIHSNFGQGPQRAAHQPVRPRDDALPPSGVQDELPVLLQDEDLQVGHRDGRRVSHPRQDLLILQHHHAAQPRGLVCLVPKSLFGRNGTNWLFMSLKVHVKSALKHQKRLGKPLVLEMFYQT